MMTSTGLRQHYPCRSAQGTIENGRYAVRCRFDVVSFSLIRSMAVRENISFAEAVRRLVAKGMEYET